MTEGVNVKRLAVMGAALGAVAALALPSTPAAMAGPKPVTTVTTTGSTTLTISAAVAARWKGLDVRLAPRPPAKQKRRSVILPVSQAGAESVRNSGGWLLVGPHGGKLAADGLLIRLGEGKETAALSFTALDQELRLMTSSDVRTRISPPKVKRKDRVTTTVRTTTITGPVQLVDDPGLVLMLNGAIGAYALMPGERIGTFTTTVVETTTVTRPAR